MVHRKLVLRDKVIPQRQADLRNRQLRIRLGSKTSNGKLPPDVKTKTCPCRRHGSLRAIPKRTWTSTATALNPHVSYLDEKNIASRHLVSGRSDRTEPDARGARPLGIKTFALWRLGAEDRSLWRVWDVPGEAVRPTSCAMFLPGRMWTWRARRDPAHRGAAHHGKRHLRLILPPE